MRRILLVFIFTLGVSGCAENMWQLSETSPHSKDLRVPGGQENNATKPGYFHNFNYSRIAEFVENAEKRKSEEMQTNSGEHITLKFTKSYISAGNHLCKLFSLSKSVKSEEPQAFDNVFCRINDRWELLMPLRHRNGQQELFNALKDTFPQRETS